MLADSIIAHRAHPHIIREMRTEPAGLEKPIGVVIILTIGLVILGMPRDK
jgi:hypothetical protein